MVWNHKIIINKIKQGCEVNKGLNYNITYQKSKGII